MSLFRLDASIRQEGSRSRAIADIVENVWRESEPDALIHSPRPSGHRPPSAEASPTPIAPTNSATPQQSL